MCVIRILFFENYPRNLLRYKSVITKQHNQFCLSCHASDGASLANGQAAVPSSLAIPALTKKIGVLLRDDPRSQPSDPKDKKVCGVIPEYLTGLTRDNEGCVNTLELIHQ